MRRPLEGLDEVFGKHMDNPEGKCIVFCAGFEYMQQMMALSEDWFSKMDPEPHILLPIPRIPAATGPGKPATANRKNRILKIGKRYLPGG